MTGIIQFQALVFIQLNEINTIVTVSVKILQNQNTRGFLMEVFFHSNNEYYSENVQHGNLPHYQNGFSLSHCKIYSLFVKLSRAFRK